MGALAPRPSSLRACAGDATSMPSSPIIRTARSTSCALLSANTRRRDRDCPPSPTRTFPPSTGGLRLPSGIRGGRCRKRTTPRPPANRSASRASPRSSPVRPGNAEAELQEWGRVEQALLDHARGQRHVSEIENFELRLRARLADQLRHLLDVARDIHHRVRTEIHGRHVEAAYLRAQREHVLDTRFGAGQRAARTGARRIFRIGNEAGAGAGVRLMMTSVPASRTRATVSR